MIESLKTHWIELIIAVLNVVALATAYFSYRSKKRADSNLIQLLKNDDFITKNFIDNLKTILNNHQKEMNKISKEYSKEPELHKQLSQIETSRLNIEIATLQSKLLTEELREISQNRENVKHSGLTNKERMNILEVLQNASMEGKVNYLNNILLKSGMMED